jgi:peptide/nickel transport system permease protein
MQYFLRRILVNIPVLFMVTVVIYLLINLAPGDPVDFFVNEEVGITKADLDHVRERFGLDDPLPVRYVKWLGRVVQGDLGFRFKNGDDVAEVLGIRLLRTLLLMGAALLIGVIFGISLGIFTGLRQYSFWDFSLTGLSFVGISMPAFVAGIFGLYIFSVKLGWFPSGGMRTIGEEKTLLDLLHHLALPALTLSLAYIATFMRFTRFSILEVRQEDYVRTAHAKGLPQSQVTRRHIFRNALIPVITVVGLSLRTLVAGALFTETIYSWPGMGSLLVDAVAARDYPMVMGIMLVTAFVVLAANLLTDLVYGFADPKIRYE